MFKSVILAIFAVLVFKSYSQKFEKIEGMDYDKSYYYFLDKESVKLGKDKIRTATLKICPRSTGIGISDKDKREYSYALCTIEVDCNTHSKGVKFVKIVYYTKDKKKLATKKEKNWRSTSVSSVFDIMTAVCYAALN